MKIIIDTREKKPFKFKGHKSVVATLKTGDYSIEGREDDLVIERKSITDFTSSITQERFWNEMERMKEIENAYLLLEFSLEHIMAYPKGTSIPKKRWKWIKIKPKFILSCIAKIEEEYGIEVVYSNNREEAALKCKELLCSGV